VINMRGISAALATMPGRFQVGVGPDPAGVDLQELTGSEEQLRNWIDSDAPLIGAPDDQVAASMLVQHTAMVLGGSMLAAALLHGSLPIAGPDGVTVAPGARTGRGATRWSFSVAPSEIVAGTPDELLPRWVEVWVDEVLGGLVDAVHSTVRVGRRMLVDDVASAAASNLVFLDWWAPTADFNGLAPTMSALGSPPIGEAIEFSTIEHGGRHGLRSTRRSCCLHFRCEPSHWCPTCPKLQEEERVQIMRTHLEHLDAVVAQRP
jgi:hypothetical protein